MSRPDLTPSLGGLDRRMVPWRRSPKLLKMFVGQHIINGVSVAAGVMAVALVSTALLGFGAGQPATLGAIGGSVSDFPAPWKVKARGLLTGFALAIVATSAIQLVDKSVAGLVVAIGVIAFIAGIVTGWGRWALALSMQMLVPMVFVLGLPPTDFHGALHNEALFALGGLGYIAIALALTRLVSSSDRRMMASECFRELSAYLMAFARFADAGSDLADVYGALIRQQAALSEQLQGARGLLLSNARATPERVRLAATIGVLLDVLDALVAAQCDLPRLRADPAAKTLLKRVGVLLRAAALDIQHLSLDLLAHEAPRLPADHSLAREATRREADRLEALEDVNRVTRAATARTMFRLDAVRARIVLLESVLRDNAAAKAAIADINLAAFAPTRNYDLKLLTQHLNRNSPVFRYATRLSLAMMAGGLVASQIGGEGHGNWVLLTIAVILRANYGLTRQRRDDRLLGTLIGCIAASAAVAYLPLDALVATQAASLALTHAFVRQNYRLASIGASMMALISLHLVDPAAHAPILARLADTLIGAAIAQAFSFVWPSWELAEAPKIARRLLGRAAGFAAVALQPGAADQDYRLARKDVIEAVTAVSDSAARMGGEPMSARRGHDEMPAMLIAVSVFVAHVSAARLDIRAAEPANLSALDPTRRWLVARLTAKSGADAPFAEPDDEKFSRLRAAALELIAAVEAFEEASQAE